MWVPRLLAFKLNTVTVKHEPLQGQEFSRLLFGIIAVLLITTALGKISALFVTLYSPDHLLSAV
jgi:hypothetical protein